MKTLKVYGASDDLIEVEGAIAAEWTAYGADKDAPVFVALSEGTLLRVWYDEDGIWRIVVVKRGEGSHVDHEAGEVPDTNDRVTIRADDFAWVVLGQEFKD